MRVNLCDHRKCRREAVEAYEVRSGWRLDLDAQGCSVAHHYEVCEKHAVMFNGGGWLRADVGERIKRDLVPS